MNETFTCARRAKEKLKQDTAERDRARGNATLNPVRQLIVYYNGISLSMHSFPTHCLLPMVLFFYIQRHNLLNFKVIIVEIGCLQRAKLTVRLFYFFIKA